jgi:HPt (histidine-containing phosphotransfer) domain-containing protein
MDVQMPEMNGYEATASIRSLGIDTPIVAVTASAQRGEEEKCISVGMSGFLIKPFKKRDLLPVLDQWLGRQDDRYSAAGNEQADSGPKSDLLDWEDALDTFMGKEEILKKVLMSFLDKLAEQVPQLRAAAAEKDLDAVRGLAHGLKGGSLNLSARTLGEAAKGLEEAAADGRADDFEDLMRAFDTVYSDFEGYVRNDILS